MLEQPGFRVFPQAFALRINEPDVRYAPAPVVFKPLRQIVIAVVRRDDFDSNVGRTGSVAAFGKSAQIDCNVDDSKEMRLNLHAEFRHHSKSNPRR